MEPCSTPSLNAPAAKPACGCATASEPAHSTVFAEMPSHAFAFEPMPVREDVPMAVPLMAAVFAAIVFARQRRPAKIVVLGIFRPEIVRDRARFQRPRLELSFAERRFFARLAERCRRLLGKPLLPAIPPLAAYSQPRLRNQ